MSTGIASKTLLFASMLGTMGMLLPGYSEGQGIFGLSEEQEIEIGKQATVEVEKEQPILDDKTAHDYVNRLGQVLVEKSGRSHLKYQFKIVNSPDVNAFALPGGFIYLNRGLIEAADNESEVAGVLAHEIGHVVGRHSVDQIKRMQITGLGLGVLGAILGQSTGAQIANVAAQLVATGAFMKFSREAEREADQLGARNAYDAGYDPQGMVTFFEKLDKMRKSQPSALDKFFASHPSPSERAENVSDLIQSLSRRGGLRVNSPDFDRIKRRLASLPAPPKPRSADATEPATPTEPGQPSGDYPGQAEDRRIAAFFAPVFHVGLGGNSDFDFPTNLEFDGDGASYNNWENAASRSYPRNAYVYYAMSETPTHYFIHYLLYFPREYDPSQGSQSPGRASSARTFKGGYDANDLESCLVVAEKQEDSLQQARVVLVEILQEEGLEKFIPGARLLGGFQALQLNGARPELQVRPGRHTLQAYSGGTTESGQEVRGWATYTYGGRAENPQSSRTREVGYDLVPLAELWARAREHHGETYSESHDYGSIQFDVISARDRSQTKERTIRLGRVGHALHGRSQGSRGNRMPWAWVDQLGNSPAMGQWFLDPATAVRRHLNLQSEFSTSYLHHPLLDLFR